MSSNVSHLDQQRSINDRLQERRYVDDGNYLPRFFDLSIKADEESLSKLLKEEPNIVVHDNIRVQLKELVEIGDPGDHLSEEEVEAQIDAYFEGIQESEYGRWVYYSWSKKLVHLLGEKEYITLRTNRNVYKITPEEQEALFSKKAGVIGLSVGQSVAVTMAMERVVGELRLADFDELELTNLNRIRVGAHQISTRKVLATAREIAEIDPYIKVRCYEDGISEQNLDNFLLEGGQLDLLIDECDGLDIKILARQRAKELRIPVVMDTSDRGMLDIERFDLEPDRPILHGLIEHLDISQVKHLKTSEEKVPYMLPMIGVDKLSERAKASMIEVGESINTWPQLASSVALGGAIATDVTRRILLDQLSVSGRFYVDPEMIIASDEEVDMSLENELGQGRILELEEMVSLAEKTLRREEGQSDFSREVAREIVKAGVQAPSGGNSQPWKWLFHKGALFLYIDSEHALMLDYQNRGSMIAMGAIVENVMQYAQANGIQHKIDLFPLGQDSVLIGIIRGFSSEQDPQFSINEHSGLDQYLYKRITNRKLAKPNPVSDEQFLMFEHAATSIPGCGITWLTDREQITQLGEVLALADRSLLSDENGHRDYVRELRWTAEEVAKTQDGLDLDTLEISAGEKAGMKIARNYSIVKKVANWGGGSAFESFSKKRAKSASAFGLLTIDERTNEKYLQSGIAMERMWLRAAEQQVGLHPMTGVVYLFERLMDEKLGGLSPSLSEKLKPLHASFLDIFPELKEGRHPTFLFRLVFAPEPEVRSLRRDVDRVLFES